MINTESLIKMEGVIALLATSLAVSDSATAINLTISNNSSSSPIYHIFNALGNDIGQSFINDNSIGSIGVSGR
jgi:hypothetical protein